MPERDNVGREKQRNIPSQGSAFLWLFVALATSVYAYFEQKNGKEWEQESRQATAMQWRGGSKSQYVDWFDGQVFG